MKFLNKNLTNERALELLDELGFLGICDLLHVYAATTDGSIEMSGPRVVVKVRTLRSAQRIVQREQKKRAEREAASAARRLKVVTGDG